MTNPLATPSSRSDIRFGPAWKSASIHCCGNPEPCTVPSETCVYRNSPRKTAKFQKDFVPCAVCGHRDILTAHQIYGRGLVCTAHPEQDGGRYCAVCFAHEYVPLMNEADAR